MLTPAQSEMVRRFYGLMSEATPNLSEDRIEDPDPSDIDAASMHILMSLMLPAPPNERERKKTIRLAEAVADWLLIEHRDKIAGYIYGDRPGNFHQTVWFCCQAAAQKMFLSAALGTA